MYYLKGKSIYVLYIFLLLALFFPRPRLVYSQIDIDTNAPYIIQVSPEDGQTNVPVNSSITVMFSEYMDDLLTNNSFWINPFIAGDIIWELDQTLIFSPSMLLNYGEFYQVSIDTKATDLSGQSIEDPYQWSFATEASPWLHFYDIQGLSLDQNNVLAILGDNTGDIWVALSSSGSSDDLFRFNGIDPTDFHKILESIGHVNALAQDSSGGVWVASESEMPNLGGVHFYDGMDWTHYSNNSNLSENTIKCLTIDSEDTIWVGSSSGIYRFNGSWTNYNMDNSNLSDNFVTAIGADENDQIWVGTVFGGIESFYDPNAPETWTNHTSNIEAQLGVGLPYTTELVSGFGKIWAGTNLGLLSYDVDTAQWELFTQIGGYLLDGGSLTSLAWDSLNNTLYVGTNVGAIMFDGANWDALLLGDVGPEVLAIAVDVYGNKWIGTTNSLSRYDTDDPSLLSFKPSANSKNVSRTGKIVFDFSEPMNRGSVLSAVSISPSFSYSSSWDIHSTKLTLTPKSKLKSNTKYSVTLSKAATDIQGHSLAVGSSWSFTTAKSSKTSTSSAYGIPAYGVSSYGSYSFSTSYQSFNLSNTLSNLYKTSLTSSFSFGSFGQTPSFKFPTSNFSLSTNFGNTFSSALNTLRLNSFNLTNNFGTSNFGNFNIRTPAIQGFQGISSYTTYPNLRFP